jgi:hypothetical protein
LVQEVAAVRGDESAVVSWLAADGNGAAVTSYTVTSVPDGRTCVTSTTSCEISGLTNGTQYTFTVVAENVIGSSADSLPSNSVTPATLPSAPTDVVAVRGSAAATVTWTAAVGNGAPVTQYLVTASPGGATCSTSATSCEFTALTNGTVYTFVVVATNQLGDSPASAASAPVTPAAAPTAVQTAKGVSNAPKRVTLSWARAVNNGDAIVSYEFAWRLQGSTTWSAWKNVGLANKITVTGWLKGKNYQFKIRATNALGSKISKNFLFKPVK